MPIPQPRGNQPTVFRPAVSIAQLIDLDPDSEPPSSHKLIEFFEKKIIKENQQKVPH